MTSTYSETLAKLAKADGNAKALTQTFAPMAVRKLASGAETFAVWIKATCADENVNAVTGKGKRNLQALRDCGFASLYNIANALARAFKPLGADGSTAYSSFPAVADCVNGYAAILSADLRALQREAIRADGDVAKAVAKVQAAKALGDGFAMAKAAKVLRKAVIAARQAFIDAAFPGRATSFAAFVVALGKALNEGRKLAKDDGDGDGSDGDGSDGDGDKGEPATAKGAIDNAIKALTGLSPAGLAAHKSDIAVLAAAVADALARLELAEAEAALVAEAA